MEKPKADCTHFNFFSKILNERNITKDVAPWCLETLHMISFSGLLGPFDEKGGGATVQRDFIV